MPDVYTVEDALSLLRNSSLPTVLTEGTDDYRILRKIEKNLSGLGVDFLPLGGRNTVLKVWERLPQERRKNTLALVDLDTWIYFGIPSIYQDDSILVTNGYSIENDLALDFDIQSLFNEQEKTLFLEDLKIISGHHAKAIESARKIEPFELSHHARELLNKGCVFNTLNVDEIETANILQTYYKQALRGKTLFQLYVKQLNSKKRRAKFGYNEIYELSAANFGQIMQNLENNIRLFFIRSNKLN